VSLLSEIKRRRIATPEGSAKVFWVLDLFPFREKGEKTSVIAIVLK
jgi:hypothetical protein